MSSLNLEKAGNKDLVQEADLEVARERLILTKNKALEKLRVEKPNKTESQHAAELRGIMQAKTLLEFVKWAYEAPKIPPTVG